MSPDQYLAHRRQQVDPTPGEMEAVTEAVTRIRAVWAECSGRRLRSSQHLPTPEAPIDALTGLSFHRRMRLLDLATVQAAVESGRELEAWRVRNLDVTWEEREKRNRKERVYYHSRPRVLNQHVRCSACRKKRTRSHSGLCVDCRSAE